MRSVEKVGEEENADWTVGATFHPFQSADWLDGFGGGAKLTTSSD